MMSKTTTRTQTIEWPGASGKSYTYYVYNWLNTFNSVPGNYIFCKIVNNQWVPIYIGEASDLSERFDNHHAMPCILRNGATHIHVHANKGGKQVRLNEETDLRHNFKAPCNKQ